MTHSYPLIPVALKIGASGLITYRCLNSQKLPDYRREMLYSRMKPQRQLRAP